MQVTAYINNPAQSGFIASTPEQGWLFHSPDLLWLAAPTVTHLFLQYPCVLTPFRINDPTEKRSKEKAKIMYNINIQLTGFKLTRFNSWDFFFFVFFFMAYETCYLKPANIFRLNWGGEIMIFTDTNSTKLTLSWGEKT